MASKLLLAVSMVLSLLLLLRYAEAKAFPGVSARKEDIKFIKCEVCLQISNQLSKNVETKRRDVAPLKLSEFQIIEMAENVCNLKKADADWILHLDIVEEGDKLKLVEQEQEGECNSECKTIEKACEEVMGDHDTDVAEFLFKGKSQGGALADFLCKDLSNVCVHKPPPVPKDRKPGEPFTPKSSKDAEMEKIMRSLGDMPGAPSMKMYSREDLMNGGMPNSEEDDEDEEEDDDDSQTVSQAKSGSRIDGLLKRTHSFINTMKVGTNNAIKSVQKKVQKTSRQFHRWWSKKTTSDRKRHSKRKSSKSSSEEL